MVLRKSELIIYILLSKGTNLILWLGLSKSISWGISSIFMEYLIKSILRYLMIISLMVIPAVDPGVSKDTSEDPGSP